MIHNAMMPFVREKRFTWNIFSAAAAGLRRGAKSPALNAIYVHYSPPDVKGAGAARFAPADSALGRAGHAG